MMATIKQISLTFYRQNHLRPDWRVDLDSPEYRQSFGEMTEELDRCGVTLTLTENFEFIIDINSYADLLNSVRITSHDDGFASICIGHVIGQSQNLNLVEDIRRAVNRIAFAPETVPPDDHNRKVCHNCGCGC
jgi:sugar phosphate isomerase/epimerase